MRVDLDGLGRVSHIVSHPVDFGGPTFPQSFIKLLPKLFKGFLVRFTQRQRVLQNTHYITAVLLKGALFSTDQKFEVNVLKYFLRS